MASYCRKLAIRYRNEIKEVSIFWIKTHFKCFIQPVVILVVYVKRSRRLFISAARVNYLYSL